VTSKTWSPHPLSTVILELLKRKGPSTDAELYDMIKEVQGDVGFNALNKELMRLEIEGAIHVSALARGKRRVELRERRANT
jgi:DNA-binding PadR family transcriptional regulator